jgi:phage-related protein
VRGFVWMGKVIVGALVNTAKFIYKFLLPVRLIAAAFVAAGKIIYAVWQVLTGDISLLEGLKAIGGAVFDFLATPFRWARDVVAGMWNFISGIFTYIGHLVTDVAAMIGNAFLNLPIMSTLRDLFATIRSFFAGDTTFFEAGKRLLITLGEGIWSAVTYPFTMLKNALSKLRGLLPFSNAKEGPLSNLTASGTALLRTLAEGISKAKSLPAQQVSESLLNLVPRLDGRLLPKALSAMLMLQPVMAQAMPLQLPIPGMVQSVTSAVEPVNRFGTMEPGMPNTEKIPTPHSQIPSEQLTMAGRNSPNTVSTGSAESGQDIRGLLSAMLSRLDALADRPIELIVTTTIDGRKVAEAVYKDLREKKIRNYETL